MADSIQHLTASANTITADAAREWLARIDADISDTKVRVALAVCQAWT